MTKAIRIHAYGGPEVKQWEDVPTPEPGPGEALVHHEAVGLNYIDVYFRTGLYKAPGLPATIGMEAAGVVTANGQWCEVDFRTFESIRVPNVHVLGDAIQVAPAMPKSGHMANQHGRVAAAAILDALLGRPTRDPADLEGVDGRHEGERHRGRDLRSVVVVRVRREAEEARAGEGVDGEAADRERGRDEPEGDGLIMAMRAGARVANTGEVWWMPGIAVDGETYDSRARVRMVYAIAAPRRTTP